MACFLPFTPMLFPVGIHTVFTLLVPFLSLPLLVGIPYAWHTVGTQKDDALWGQNFLPLHQIRHETTLSHLVSLGSGSGWAGVPRMAAPASLLLLQQSYEVGLMVETLFVDEETEAK